MLTRLSIKNYAIIQEAKINFDANLNIITGETGAGKSILIGALGLILGERADSKVLMHSDEKCIVEGVFTVSGYNLQDFFVANELDYEAQCIIRREINTSGKSRAFVNDTPVNLPLLKELGTKLVEIVSQHQTLELNEKSFQLQLLDTIGDNQQLLVDYQSNYTLFLATEKRHRELVELELQSRKEEDYLRFILNELNEANPVIGEQEKLEEELDKLNHAESIQQSSTNAYQLLMADEQAIIEQLRQIKLSLVNPAKHHPGLMDVVSRLDSLVIELKDISNELEHIGNLSQANPESLLMVETRLQVLYNLHKKHRVNTNAELISLMEKLNSDMQKLGNLQEEITRLDKQRTELTVILHKQATILRSKREKVIPVIEKKISELLKQVEMPNAFLKVQLTPRNHFNETGLDEVDLLFTANKGAPPMPLSKVASGGELSRLMLCIKSLISDRVALPTIVFDEIDTGISGEAALKVSQVMKQHASKHQVLAITHLPQIAGKADSHFFVYKTSDKNTTHTFIKKLNLDERLDEIARMLHGDNPSEKVKEAARELITNP